MGHPDYAVKQPRRRRAPADVGVVRGRPGGVERVGMGAKRRGGAGDFIGGLGRGFDGLEGRD